jgi:Raf kinase inhibitor-like YbhB/YbcL family protein
MYFFIYAPLLLLTYWSKATDPDGSQESRTGRSFILSSAAFKDGGNIPIEYTGYGKNRSPQFSWINTPANTRSFALICEDLDAPSGKFIHLIAFNIDSRLHEIPKDGLKAGGSHDWEFGKNSFGTLGYEGPKPPDNKPHRYVFTLYALDSELDLESGASINAVKTAIDRHFIDSASLTGLYQKPA